MITWKIQCRECHVLDVGLFSSVILPSMHNFKVPFSKQDEIFWIDITIGAFVRLFAGFVELWLQVCTRVECCVIGRVGHITPTGCQIVRHVMLTPFENILLLAWLGFFIRVGIKTEYKLMRNKRRVRSHSLHNCAKNRFCCQPIGISMERSNHEGDTITISGSNCQDVPFSNRDSYSWLKRALHKGCDFSTGSSWESFLGK
mmetsp:Transcript_21194/g.32029  ORF Transcript_21194/g.32029 Transcript_21194/m.32029 type:complete len:201 (+) Transcript_21194:692-1294(+)